MAIEIWQDALPYFSKAELRCKCGCDRVEIDMRFAALLPALRQLWGRPLTPTSVCRCPKHNQAVGGHPTSLHLIENPKWPSHGTAAADISWRGWAAGEKMRFARLAQGLGLRVGLHDGFAHLDLGRQLGTSPMPFIYSGVWTGPFGPGDIA